MKTSKFSPLINSVRPVDITPQNGNRQPALRHKDGVDDLRGAYIQHQTPPPSNQNRNLDYSRSSDQRPVNFSRPFTSQTQNIAQQIKLTNFSRAFNQTNSASAPNSPSVKPQQHDPQSIASGMPDNRYIYESMHFKSKRKEFRDFLNPFKPHSDIKMLNKMDEDMNTTTGRALGSVTGQSSAQGIIESLELLGHNMRPGDTFTLGKYRGGEIEPRVVMSLGDIVAPGAGNAGIRVGPTVWGGISAGQNKHELLEVSKSEGGRLHLKGSHQHTCSLMLKGAGGVAVGVDAGPVKLGPLALLNGEVGAQWQRSKTSTLSAEFQPAEEISAFVQKGNKSGFSGERWQNTSVTDAVTYPAKLKVEVAVHLVPPAYGPHGRLGNVGLGACETGVSADDLQHPRTTSRLFFEGKGKLNMDIGLTNNSGAGGVDLRGQAETKVTLRDCMRDTIQDTVRDKRNEHNANAGESERDRILHGSHWNRPFNRSQHVDQLNNMVGAGSSQLAINQLRNELGQNIPQRNMEFVTKVLDDGRVRIDGRVKVGVADGFTVNAPFVKYANEGHVEISQTRPLFETPEVIYPPKK